MKKGLFLSLAFLALTACSLGTPVESTEVTNVEVQKVQITSSIVPISSLLNSIGGEYVEVQNIVPAGVSPHGFDLSAKQMARLSQSEKVFLIGLEHIDGFLEKAANTDIQIRLADGMELLEASGDDHHDEHEDSDNHDENEESHSDEEEGHNMDPHVWLGKQNIIDMTDIILAELSLLLPEQATYFQENADIFLQDMEDIYTNFSEEISGKSPTTFIVFHDAYNYLFASIDLSSGYKKVFSDNFLHDSTAAHLSELEEEIETNDIRIIFREPQFQTRNVEDFATTYGLTIQTLDPLGVDSEAGGYLKNLQSNLNNLSAIYE